MQVKILLVSAIASAIISCNKLQTDFAPPELTPPIVMRFSSTYATLGGHITSSVGSAVTEKGFVYSSNDNTDLLTVENADDVNVDVTKAISDATTDSFSVEIIGLSPNTEYYFKSYATNSSGTSYGYAVSFTTTLRDGDFGIVGFSILLNPITGILNIAFPFLEEAEYSLLNTKGQVLKKGTLIIGNNKINLSSLPKGIYFLSIKTSKGSFTHKVEWLGSDRIKPKKINS